MAKSAAAKKPASATAAKPAAAGNGQATRPTPEPKAGTNPARSVTHEEIALAAYLRWEKFGGDQETNWAEAERQLRGA